MSFSVVTLGSRQGVLDRGLIECLHDVEFTRNSLSNSPIYATWLLSSRAYDHRTACRSSRSLIPSSQDRLLGIDALHRIFVRTLSHSDCIL